MDSFAAWLEPFLNIDSLLGLPLVLIGGLITAVNPCCLPLYPAVFGFIGRTSIQQTDSSRATGQTAISLGFILGMASATTLMGLLTASLGWVFGQFHPMIRLALAAIPLLMGLHLLGLLPLRLPTWHLHQPTITNNGSVRRMAGAYAAGLAFSLAIAPCTTPILLGILTLVALQGDLAYGAVLMFVYSVGAGLPLLLIGHGFERWRHCFTAPVRQRQLRNLSGALLTGVGVYVIWTAV